MKRKSSRLVFVFIIHIVFSANCAGVVNAADTEIDFNRDVRSILSNKCFKCHGPDENERQSGLRLDERIGATTKLESDNIAIVPGKLAESELITRITDSDPDTRMPPADSGKNLSAREIKTLTDWVRQGAPYAEHWSYVKPTRPAVPKVARNAGDSTWPRNAIDSFLLRRLHAEGLSPSPEADRYALVRRVSLDLTGLPPAWQEVQQFVNDSDPKAFEKLVDRLLEKQSYGEHWARMWLDLARYADSAGYADDPPRVIWAFRDYVIRSLNANKPFDQFTIEQIAGDLLPNPTDEQLVATAFHRNTLTNNEGGTNDEEFRNVAIVDRVNTTMAVWMGTTIDCAQCHNHKFDPISQEEFFRLFAILNNTQDADKRDESPRIELWSDEQEQQKTKWKAEIAELENTLVTATPKLLAAQTMWEQQFTAEPKWQTLQPSQVQLKSAGAASINDDGSVFVKQARKTDVYTVTTQPAAGTGKLTAIRLETIPHDSLPKKGAGHSGGNFVVTRVLASVVPPVNSQLNGRYVRIENTGKARILSLAEVQILSGGDNIAGKGETKQSSTAHEGPAKLAIDGNTNGDYAKKSTTHTNTEDNPWWEIDLKALLPIDQIVVWNRTDNNLHTRLKDFRITVLDENRKPVWEQKIVKPPKPNGEYSLTGVREIQFAAAFADFSQNGFAAERVLDIKKPNESGWAVGAQTTKPHALTLILKTPANVPDGSKVTVTIEQLSKYEKHVLGNFRIGTTTDAGVAEYAKTPSTMLAIIKTAAENRSSEQQAHLTNYFLGITPDLKSQRERLARVQKQLTGIKPYTTVPILRAMAEKTRRKTLIQHRGNFLDTGKEVTEGVPSAFHAIPAGQPANRLTLARWLVDKENPLTARVIVNRYWEKIFGIGIVQTSEEFGTQGELPSHPKLLDWLATEFVDSGWDLKHLVKLLVTSAAYRQSSRVNPMLLERDPENRLLARGPRFRLSAEMVRDQALFVGGLLSSKMYGPPVKPPQPTIGLKAAFGSGIDWKTSEGEDRYRRGLYTTWRRSNPYPSMAAFDAPNREVCTIRRDRTNTPLQALVTLNDPVYVEAAQSLARRMAKGGNSVSEKTRFGIETCLSRSPRDKELALLTRLYETTYQRFSKDTDKALQMATKPLGPVPEGSDIAELAAFTVVSNVLLNLDEMFLKR